MENIVNESEGIEGKVVVITGASSGIGEATSALLAKRSAKIVLAARNLDSLKKVAARINENGGNAAYFPTDVSKRAEVSDLIEFALEKFGKIDVLVNNAGVMPISLLEELRVKDWELMIDVNIKGVLYGIAAALPVFKKQGSGHFINIASTAGHKTVPTQAVYSGTKYAVRAISEGLRQEAGDNFRVTIISPGFVNTNFANGIQDETMKAQMEKRRDEIAIPPEAVARAIAFAIEQPNEVDVNEIIIRPTIQN